MTLSKYCIFIIKFVYDIQKNLQNCISLESKNILEKALINPFIYQLVDLGYVIGQMGKLKKILITGGSGRVTGEGISEATDMKKVFLLCGVPDSVLLLELNARNTHENALFTKKMIDSLSIKGSKLLITSAFHMPRSKACFDKVGLETTIFPTDFSGGATTLTPDVWVVPSEKAFLGWHVLVHEWMGYIVYKLVGYA